MLCQNSVAKMLLLRTLKALKSLSKGKSLSDAVELGGGETAGEYLVCWMLHVNCVPGTTLNLSLKYVWSSGQLWSDHRGDGGAHRPSHLPDGGGGVARIWERMRRESAVRLFCKKFKRCHRWFKMGAVIRESKILPLRKGLGHLPED